MQLFKIKHSSLVSLHVFLKEFPVEVVPYGIINEALWGLGFTTSLVFEYHIIVPSDPGRWVSIQGKKRELGEALRLFREKQINEKKKKKVARWSSNSNLLFTLKEAGLLSSGFPFRSSASLALSSSSRCSRSYRCIKQRKWQQFLSFAVITNLKASFSEMHFKAPH